MRSFQMLAKWMGYIETHATADVRMMILGSKSDLDSFREVQIEEGRKVCRHIAHKMALINYL